MWFEWAWRFCTHSLTHIHSDFLQYEFRMARLTEIREVAADWGSYRSFSCLSRCFSHEQNIWRLRERVIRCRSQLCVSKGPADLIDFIMAKSMYRFRSPALTAMYHRRRFSDVSRLYKHVSQKKSIIVKCVSLYKCLCLYKKTKG